MSFYSMFGLKRNNGIGIAFAKQKGPLATVADIRYPFVLIPNTVPVVSVCLLIEAAICFKTVLYNQWWFDI